MSEWSSSLGFVLATVGSAVGLANIWRFPITVQQNGGGAYLIPYLITTFAFGLPLMIVAVSAGRHYGTDVITIFEKVNKGYLAWIVLAIGLVILSFYLVVTGWILGFIWFALTGFETTFNTFTSGYTPIPLFSIATVLCGAIVSYGVEDGIEKAVSILIPVLFAVLIGLVIYSFTLDGFEKGVEAFLQPDFSIMTDPTVWISAFGQSFFSLSVGLGILPTFGSYLDESVDIPKMAVAITLANFSVAFMTALIIFPLSYSSQGGSNLAGGVELAFRKLPEIFQALPFGNILGAIFFGIFFIAAVSSSISLLEVSVSVGIGKGIDRLRSSIIVTVILLTLGIPSALSYSAVGFDVSGTPILDIINNELGSLALPVMALMIIAGLTWFLKEKFVESRYIHNVVKYVLPVILTILLFFHIRNLVG